jgi:DNA repair exonuclease SbcCD nuclease subunit
MYRFSVMNGLLCSDRNRLRLAELFEPRINLMREDGQVLDGVLMRHWSGMAHHQEISHSAAVIDEIGDLPLNLIRRAAEHHAGINQILYAALGHLHDAAVLRVAARPPFAFQYTDIVLD